MKHDELLPGVNLAFYEKMRTDGKSPLEVFAHAWQAELSPVRCVRLVMVVFDVSLKEGLDIMGEAHQRFPDLKPYEGEFYS